MAIQEKLSRLGAAKQLQRAVAHLHAGDTSKAEIIVKKILNIVPNLADAHHILGIILIRKQLYKQATDTILKAIKLNPNSADYYNTLGRALQVIGHLDAALKSYERAIELDPKLLDARKNQGSLLLNRGQLNDALSAFKVIVDIFPDLPDGHNFCGVALYNLGRFEEALSAYRYALHLNPRYTEAHNNAGIVLQKSGRIKEALTAFDRAIQINHNYANAHYNRGNALSDLGHLEEASRSYKSAITILPNFALAHNNLGNILLDLGKPAEALIEYDHAIQHDPDNPDFHNNRGNALRTLGNPLGAIDAYNNAIHLDGSLAVTYNNLGAALSDLGHMEKALNAYELAIATNPQYAAAYSHRGSVLINLGRYSDADNSYRHAQALDPDDSESHSNLLLALNYRSDLTPEDIFINHREWGINHAQKYSNQEASLIIDKSERSRRIRVGYVSADFRMHSVAYFFEPLLTYHDRNKVEIFCYSNTKCPDSVTERLQSKADHWTPIVGLSDDVVAKIIRRDRIDILVDLSGHTGGNRLLVFARRPAPVQLSWLGYPNTTGMQAMDYRVTDDIADPIGKSESLHTEKLVRLRNGFLCYQPPQTAPEVSLAPVSLNNYITFGSFNNLLKVNDDVVSVWSEILRKVPESHLLLKSRYLGDEGCTQRYLSLFAKNGIDTRRIRMQGRLPELRDHLSLYSKVDIGLDTFPYNGTTTTFEALWMGIPVITLSGNRHASRVGASILQHAGYSDWIATNPASYIDIAIHLASNINALAETRRSLRGRIKESTLCDGEGFTQNLEVAYRAIQEEAQIS